MASLTDIAEEIRLASRALGEFGAGLFNPTVRLGVTGLSGAGKTVKSTTSRPMCNLSADGERC